MKSVIIQETLEIVIIFIIHGSQCFHIYSDTSPSSDALFFNVYEVLSNVIEISFYVASWLLNLFTNFSLRDLTCVVPSIKLDECGHVECSAVMGQVILNYPQIHSVGRKGSLWIL